MRAELRINARVNIDIANGLPDVDALFGMTETSLVSEAT